VAVPRQTVLWPSVASLVTPVDAALLTPQAATRWPLLLDIDAPIGPVSDANGNTPADTCCWPSLGPSFRDRWNEMPATWFFAALKLELKP
jgi:hypothetical protein